MRQWAGSLARKVLPTRQLRGARHRLLAESAFLTQQFWLRRRGVAFYNFWETPEPRNRWFARFLQRPALVRLARKRRVAFVSVFGERSILPRIQADAIIFYTGENLANRPAYGDHLFGEVDLALGFDHLQRADYLRFPLWLLMCFEPHYDHADIDRQLQAWTERRRTIVSRPPMEASMVARYDPDGSRARIGDLYAGYGTVHYGGAFRGTGALVPPGHEHKAAFLRQYPLTLCPENSSRPGYVTEKLFQALAAGCIPVYAGPPDAIEPGIINEDAILYYPFDRPEKLVPQLTALRDRQTALRDWSVQSPFCAGASERIHTYYLDLESRLIDLLT